MPLNSKFEQKREDTTKYYALRNCTIHDILQENKTDILTPFDKYWEEKQGEALLTQAEEVERKSKRD